MLAKEGELKEAKVWYNRAAKQGNNFALIDLVKLLESNGEFEEAKTVYKRMAKQGLLFKALTKQGLSEISAKEKQFKNK